MASTTFVALLRGINVGRAKRIAMADLRSLIESLGYANVRTVLNSGNAVFDGSAARHEAIAEAIESALEHQLKVPSRTTVLTAATFRKIVAGNPLVGRMSDPARMIVGFLHDSRVRNQVRTLERSDHGDERIAVADHAIYLWCPHGLLQSELFGEMNRILRNDVTTRNWSTVNRILAVLDKPIR
jgi:uncharacterized protein (DUF1697 family)